MILMSKLREAEANPDTVWCRECGEPCEPGTYSTSQGTFEGAKKVSMHHGCWRIFLGLD